MNLKQFSFIGAGIGLALGTSVNASEITKTSYNHKNQVSKIIENSSVIIKNPLSNVAEELEVKTDTYYKTDSEEFKKMIRKRQEENLAINQVNELINIMYEYMKIGSDISNEEIKLMKIYKKNCNNEDINFNLGKFLLEINGSSESIRNYFLQTLKIGSKHKEEIENIYFSKIFTYIKENPSRLNEPFLASLIIDFIPYISQEIIINSGLKNDMINNLLLIKEYKHNLNILEKSDNKLLSVEFIEVYVMELYRKNQDNVDINFIMGEYMLKHGLFPSRMRDCFLKALKGGNKYSDVIHKIFLSRIINLIKDNNNSINNNDYKDIIANFMPYIKDDIDKIGINISKK